MAKIIWRANDRVWKDDGDPAADGTVAIRLGGTGSSVTAYTNIDLDEGAATSFNIASDGYLENNATLYVADDVTVDLYITATGFNGGLPLTVPNVAVADPTTTDTTSSQLALGNAVPNGGFEAWSHGTSFSALSGDSNGVVTADGWFFAANSTNNAVSRHDGFSIDGIVAPARYCIRWGLSSSAGDGSVLQRLWATLKPETVARLRGRDVTLRITMRRGAGLTGTGPAPNPQLRVATGTTENEDGDLMFSDGFAGQINALNTYVPTVTTVGSRLEYTFSLSATAKEVGIGIQHYMTGASSSAYLEVQDIEIKAADQGEEFSAVPEAIEFLQTNLTTGGRLFVSTTFTDPGSDVITGWDDSAGAIIGYTPAGGITTSTTNLQLDLTYAAVWTGLHTHNRAVDADIINWGNTTTTHDMLVRWASSGTLFEFTPAPSGTADNTKGMGYDVTNSRWFVDTNLSVTGVVIASQGGTSAPGFAFASATNYGFYYVTGDVAIAVNGGAGFSINTARAQSFVPFYVPDGSVTAPAFGWRTESGSSHNSGRYRLGTANYGESVSGVLVFDWNATRLLMGAGYDLRLPATAVAPTGVYSAGYRGAPVVSGNSAYAFPAADAGHTVYHDEASSRTYTIPANASVAHPIGTMFIIDNTGNSGSAGTITLAITSDTLRRGDGTSGTGSRTIAANQVAVIRKTKSTEWVCTGGFS